MSDQLITSHSNNNNNLQISTQTNTNIDNLSAKESISREISTQTLSHRGIKFNRHVSNTINHKRNKLNDDQTLINADIEKNESIIRDIERTIIHNSNIKPELEKRKTLQTSIVKTLKALRTNLRKTFYVDKHTTHRYKKTEERKTIESRLSEQLKALNSYVEKFRGIQCLGSHKQNESCALCYNPTPSYNVSESILAQTKNPQQTATTMGKTQVPGETSIRKSQH
jgi:hypothetical protein